MFGGRKPPSQVDGQHLLHPGVGEEEVSLDRSGEQWCNFKQMFMVKSGSTELLKSRTF